MPTQSKKLRIAAIPTRGPAVYLAGTIFGCRAAAKAGTAKQMLKALDKALKPFLMYSPLPDDPRSFHSVRFEIVDSNTTYLFPITRRPTLEEWQRIEAQHE